MKREMEAVIIVNREFHDYEAKVLEFPNGYVLRLQHKYLHNKKMLVEALFNKKRENPIDFALSLGSTQDEMIHHSVMSRRNYAILVKDKNSLGEYLGTHANYRLKDNRKVISLLENLVGINVPNRSLESIRIFFQGIKEKIVVCQSSFLLIVQMRHKDFLTKVNYIHSAVG
jgi:hypothetical protein